MALLRNLFALLVSVDVVYRPLAHDVTSDLGSRDNSHLEDNLITNYNLIYLNFNDTIATTFA